MVQGVSDKGQVKGQNQRACTVNAMRMNELRVKEWDVIRKWRYAVCQYLCDPGVIYIL